MAVSSSLEESLTKAEYMADDLWQYFFEGTRYGEKPFAKLLEIVNILEQNYCNTGMGYLFNYTPSFLTYRSRMPAVKKFKQDITQVITSENIGYKEKILCIELISKFIKEGAWHADSSANMYLMAPLFCELYRLKDTSKIELLKTRLAEHGANGGLYCALKARLSQLGIGSHIWSSTSLYGSAPSCY